MLFTQVHIYFRSSGKPCTISTLNTTRRHSHGGGTGLEFFYYMHSNQTDFISEYMFALRHAYSKLTSGLPYDFLEKKGGAASSGTTL